MAENKIKRKIVWDKSGVSEIIGTILMLSITVVLFSGIITMVGSMPAPRQTFIVDLKCSLQPVNQTEWNQGIWMNGIYFRVLHQGGQVLEPLWTDLYITVDDSMISKKIVHGLMDTNGDGKWGVGEWWVYRINPGPEAPTLDTDSIFTITIVDQEKNALVWHETMGEGANYYGPIIKRAWIDSDMNTPVDDPGPIGFEKSFKIYCEIIDPEGFDAKNGLNRSNLWVNVSSILPDVGLIQLWDVMDSHDLPNDNIYVAYCEGPPKMSIGYYLFKFLATDNSNRTANPFLARFPVGLIVGEKPQIVVKGDQFIKVGNTTIRKYDYITFSDPQPTNGDSIDIIATILNLGGKGAEVNVWFYLDELNQSALINSDPVVIQVPEVGQQDARISWTASPGGAHIIWVNASVRDETADFYDPDLSDNQNCTNISVMPKILLVDDDTHVNDLSEGDTVSSMQASLEAADFKYDFVTVGTGDGPRYDEGDFALKKYDVVIWMTGYRTSKTLTVSTNPNWDERTDDIANLQRYLAGTANKTITDGKNGGSLWLISEGFWPEASSTAALGAFATDTVRGLRIPNMMADANTVALPPKLYGDAVHPVTDYFADTPINTDPGTTVVKYWDYPDIPFDRAALYDYSVQPELRKVFAVSYDSDKHLNDTIQDSRILAQTWDFSRIKDTATQTQYTYKAILWLGKIESKFTNDVAISEQTTEPTTVFYKQQVTIKFVVRNNGLNNYTSADNLLYLLRIIDMDGIDTITPFLKRIDFLGIKSNNTLTISFNWTPQQIGYHRISIKVDPYNYIEESNELNNEISSFWGTGELNVLYRVLVVDDDGSANNLGGFLVHDETKDVLDALDFLGYSNETYVVLGTGPTDNGPALSDGFNGTALNEYNAIIWVTGAAPDPLTGRDRENITGYLELGGNVWIIGNGIWSTDNDVDLFERNYLKIDSVDRNHNVSAAILGGVKNDYVSHGMQYATTGDPDADILFPTAGAYPGIGFTYQDQNLGRFNSVRYDGPASTNASARYRSAVTAWQLSSLSDPLSRAEFVFMMLRWFDKPEERIETRIANIDVWISEEHPQLGSGYVIQARVQNAGGTTGNVLVRFMDGTTQIGSDSISVSPGGWTTAEIIWVPLFAGQRTITILVDPIKEVDEIFEWSNNNATRSIYVYFFWDNMEKGAGKWAHSATTLLINGEEAIEYFYDTALNTNIITDWDTGESVPSEVETIKDIGFYHSYDTAFWLQEPSGAETVYRVPMDVVLIIDTSATMPAPDLANAKAAASNFVSLLNQTDRCSLFQLTSDAAARPVPFMALPLNYMTTGNKDFCHDTVNSWIASGYSPLWDATGSAIAYLTDPLNKRAGETPGINYVQVIILLTNDHDKDAAGSYEMGSQTYCPGALQNEGFGQYTWGGLPGFAGNVWGQSHTYIDLGGTGKDIQRYTSLGLQWPDLAFETRSGMLRPPCIVNTIALSLLPNDPAHTNYKLTTDYDLSRLASTSGQMGISGRHYQTLFSNNLTNVYSNILWQITTQLSGDNQTRSSGPMPEPMTTHTYNFAGVDPIWANPNAFYCDVDDATSAELQAPNTQTELLMSQYGLVSASDDNRWTSPDPGQFDEVFIKCQMVIVEPVANIANVDLIFEVQAAANPPTYQMYARRVAPAPATWVPVGTDGTGTANSDYMFTRSLPANIADYISGGLIEWGCYYTTDKQELTVDYIAMKVRMVGSTPPNIPTFVSHGGNTTAAGGITPDETPSLNWGYSDNQTDPQEGFIVNVFDNSDDSLVWSSNLASSSANNVTVGSIGIPLGTNLVNGRTYYWTCQVLDDSGESALAGGKGRWWFTVNVSANSPPSAPYNPYPKMNQGGISAIVTMMWQCDDIDGDILTYSLYLDTVNPPVSLVETTLITNSSVRTLNQNTIYYWRVLAYDGVNSQVSSPVWIFATGGGTGGGYDWSNLGISPAGPNMNKTAVTETMNLDKLASAKLSFWHKYNMMTGSNGGFLQVGYKDPNFNGIDDWDWKYITPANAYTGNLRSNVYVKDDFGTRVYWCWNGISTRGTFSWDYVSVDLLNFVPADYRDEVKVKFNYTQYGGGTGYGWYIDDVRMEVTRSNNVYADQHSQDIWNLTTADAHSGTHCWANVNPVPDPVYGYGLVKPGIDNYLRTMPIDLTNARTATLSAYVKFNFNYQSGAPPDGFRIEVSRNNGITWEAVNLGVRSGWNISGTSSDDSDGYINDQHSYTGISDSTLAGTGTAATDRYWVSIGTMTRVDINLSSFSGNAIVIRFRMITCGHPAYAHSNNLNQGIDPGFGGFYLDDVEVKGQTILG